MRWPRTTPESPLEDWYIDIMSAKLVNENGRNCFQVFVLPNLYGDIITDEAAQIQGGVGTAGSANLGDRYAMFEAIHGSAPRMIEEGRGAYANPVSTMRASVCILPAYLPYRRGHQAGKCAGLMTATLPFRSPGIPMELPLRRSPMLSFPSSD